VELSEINMEHVLLGYHSLESVQLISVTLQLWRRTDWITDISWHASN
jgi:hypothetical protein